jgi:hypothetical protein
MAKNRVTGLGEFSRIGRLFDIGSFFENYRSIPHFGYTFFYGKSYELILTKNGLGFILGEFFSLHHLVTLA